MSTKYWKIYNTFYTYSTLDGIRTHNKPWFVAMCSIRWATRVKRCVGDLNPHAVMNDAGLAIQSIYQFCQHTINSWYRNWTYVFRVRIWRATITPISYNSNGGNRTLDLRLIRPTLWPTELHSRGHSWIWTNDNSFADCRLNHLTIWP